MELFYLFLVVFSFICLCLSGTAFFGSLALAFVSGWKNGLAVLGIFFVLFLLLSGFIVLYPGGAEAWATVIFFMICITGQFAWIGKFRHQKNRLYRIAMKGTLACSVLLLLSMNFMNAAFALR